MKSGYVEVISKNSEYFGQIGWEKDTDQYGTVLVKLVEEEDRIWFLPTELQEISYEEFIEKQQKRESS